MLILGHELGFGCYLSLNGSKPALDAGVARWHGSYMWGPHVVGYIPVYFHYSADVPHWLFEKIIHNFFIWARMRTKFISKFCSWKVFESKLFRVLKYCCTFINFKIWNLKLSENLGCWHSVYESYSSQYNLQLCSWKAFYLNSFSIPNMSSKFLISKSINLENIFGRLNNFK
jgi:hypothetical protein